MDTLKQIVLYMSENKMNNLGIHLNDNENPFHQREK